MSKYQLYGNVKGESEPVMRHLSTIDTEELPGGEAEAACAIEAALKVINSFQAERQGQAVVVQDGVIVAVEALATRELLWCK